MNTFIFDIGKTNLKCYVLDADGGAVWSTSQPNEVVLSKPYPHFAIEDIWLWLQQSLQAAGKLHSIDAINISTHGACSVLLDDQGELVLPVLDYEYSALDTADDHYDKVRPDFARSFSPRLPAGLNLGRQLWWLKHRYSESFASTQHLLMYPQFWAWKLSGVMAIERTSLGCHTDLWLPVADDYSPLIDQLGLRHALPRMVSNDKAIGLLLPEIAEATGLSVDCRIYPGVHDSNASLASHLYPIADQSQWREMAVVSAGTWIITMALRSVPVRLIETRDMLANVNVLGQLVSCARFMGGREFEIICECCETKATDPLDASDVQQLIAEQIFALPSFVTGTGPYPDNKGRLYNALNHQTCDPKQINGKALATLYTVLMIDTQLDLLGVTGDIIFGSTSKKNPLICQLLAQLRPQQAILLSGTEAGTVKGCWVLTQDQTTKSELAEHYEQAIPSKIKGLSSYRDIWHRLLGTE